MPSVHREAHRLDRVGWLRAAVLGANDGIVSTASLVVGVAAAGQDRAGILLAGLAGLVGGALSMAAGEYVSVSSQSDLEAAALAQEERELAADPEREQAELAGIYRERGLSADLADQVAAQLTHVGALTAHARDELNLSDFSKARPLAAAVSSAAAFASGAVLPIVAAVASPFAWLSWSVGGVTLISLAALGALGARLGSAPPGRAMARVTLTSLLALLISAAIGRALGVSI